MIEISKDETLSNLDSLQDNHYLNLDGALVVLRDMGFDISKRQLYDWASRGHLPFFKQGKSLFISKGELIRHLRAKQTRAIRGTVVLLTTPR